VNTPSQSPSHRRIALPPAVVGLSACLWLLAACGSDPGGDDVDGSVDGSIVLDGAPGDGSVDGTVEPLICTDDTSDHTIGLLSWDPRAAAGYTLFAPVLSETTYLIDLCGRRVHSWESTRTPGQSVYLLDNGDLLRTEVSDPSPHPVFDSGGSGGRVRRLAWEGTVLWEFEYVSDDYLPHHDVEPLPNGNVLMIAWERKNAAEAVAAGRDPAQLEDGELWPDHLIEVEPSGATGGTIVWEWHVWDHLIQDYDPTQDNYGVVADHPELADLNYMRRGVADWTHVNAVDYDPALDQILLTVHGFNEVWVIDHSTTTQQAAGHAGGNSGRGGDILYRWGNPQAYGAGTAADQQLFAQHDGRWIEPHLPGEGNILIFNNGNDRPVQEYSTVEELTPPVDGNGQYPLIPGTAFEPAAPLWSYSAPNPTDFYSSAISGSQRLGNGNTLICSGHNGYFFEVTTAGEVVWEYINPVIDGGPLQQGDSVPARRNRVFRAHRYTADHPGLAGRDLTPGTVIER